MGILSKYFRSEVEVQPDAPSADGGSGSGDLASLRAQASASGNRGAKGKANSKARLSLALADAQDKLDKLFHPKHFKKIVQLPFKLRYVMTGDPDFELSDEERDSLGESLAVMAQTLAEWDPRTLSAVIFTASFCSVMIEKETIHRRNVKLAQLRHQQQQQPPA